MTLCATKPWSSRPRSPRSGPPSRKPRPADGPGHSPPASSGGGALGALAASSARAQPVYDDGYEYGPPEYDCVYRRRFVMRESEPPFEPLGFHDDWDD